MGGKKKTKWRKLPLEEFTKEIPPKEEKTSTDACRTDTTREETDFIPNYNGPPEVIQNYTEPYEYIDGVWYPTSCVVYNPGLFSNYMVPTDTCYYYCTMPEAGQMQDYMPVPYQEYIPALPKDTVYLLLPTQTLRPTQPVQNLAPEWHSRRRRRRYEGYAEYAVIPEKTSSSKSEVKDHSRLSGSHSRRSTHYNNFRRMSSFSETSSSDGLASEPNQIPKKPQEMKKDPADNEKKPIFTCLNKEVDLPNLQNGQASKKNAGMCGVHSSGKTTTKENLTENGKINTESTHNELNQDLDMSSTDTGDLNQPDNSPALEIAGNKMNACIQKQSFGPVDNKTSFLDAVDEGVASSYDSSEDKEINTESSFLKLNDDLPEETTVKKEAIVEERDTKTEDLHSEMEKEFKMLQSFAASQTNQAIYKLAYDENITDQSSNSRSPSPILSPQEQIPCTYYENEIVVHEANSDDDAGSEDLELIPHRYESESYLNKRKHKNLCVNKLSLAVEMLRTREDLPYDANFKRIVDENDDEPRVHKTASQNLRVKRDSRSTEKTGLVRSLANLRGFNTNNRNVVTTERQLDASPDSHDSAIFSDQDTSLGSMEEKSPESTKENVSGDNETQGNTDENRAILGRLPARRRFIPLPFNPCFCCIIM